MSSLRMVINALKVTQIKLKNWISLVGALFLWASRAPWHMFLLLCQQHRSHDWSSWMLIDTRDAVQPHLSAFCVTSPALTDFWIEPSVAAQAAHIYSLLQDHVMTKMLIASKCCHTRVMRNHSQNREGSHRRRWDPSETTGLFCCKCSFCAFIIQPSLNTVMQVTA